MKLVSSGSRRFVLLAPAQCAVPASFTGVQSDSSRHQDLLFEMQELRGRVYLEDGAIRPDELLDGRHSVDVDGESWHLLILNEHQQVRGCIRCRQHSTDIDPQELAVSNSALARSIEWRGPLENALLEEFEIARRRGCDLAEAGGLALDQEIRGTTEALRLVLAIYALTELLGGVVGLSTVTQRHCSASILRRIGGRPLESDGLQLPSYYDPKYDCQMEVMRFYSWDPNPRYRVWVDEIKAELAETCVLTRQSHRQHAYRAYASSRGLR
jgi:predicted GNAT family N-acyltransferase